MWSLNAKPGIEVAPAHILELEFSCKNCSVFFKQKAMNQIKKGCDTEFKSKFEKHRNKHFL